MNLKELNSINYKKIYDKNTLFANEKTSSSPKEKCKHQPLLYIYLWNMP